MSVPLQRIMLQSDFQQMYMKHLLYPLSCSFFKACHRCFSRSNQGFKPWHKTQWFNSSLWFIREWEMLIHQYASVLTWQHVESAEELTWLNMDIEPRWFTIMDLPLALSLYTWCTIAHILTMDFYMYCMFFFWELLQERQKHKPLLQRLIDAHNKSQTHFFWLGLK